MPIKKYIAASMALTLSLMHAVPAYADSSDSIENIMNIQMSSVEQTISNVSDLVLNTMDSVSVEHTESIEIDSDSYLMSEPVYVYTEQAEAEPVMTTIEVPDEWIYGIPADNEEIITEDNQDYINEAQANYEAALKAYEQALAEYEAASQIIEITREEEVQVTEEVEDEEGNLVTATRTEIQPITKTSYTGDVESAQLNLDAASTVLQEKKVQLEKAESQIMIKTPEVDNDELIDNSELIQLESTENIIVKDIDTVSQNSAISTSGRAGNNLKWTLDDSGLLTITGSGEMDNYSATSILPWGKSIKKVVFEDGVKRIGDYAFASCKDLTEISLPKNGIQIGNYAFSSCTALNHLYIPSGTDFFLGSFSKCTGLKTAGPVGSGCDYEFEWYEVIPDRAFYDLTELVSVIIPMSITRIEECAFWGCSKLNYLDLPDNVVEIGTQAFCNCAALTNFAIPNRMTIIPDSLFSGCTNLLSITIPNSITKIGKYAFRNCRSLTDVKVPNGLTVIDDGAFYDCTVLTINIPNKLKHIGAYAFYKCRKITEIALPESVAIVDAHAFSQCTKLKHFTTANSISIGEYAFEGCTGLTYIAIPWRDIQRFTFYGCTSLTQVIINNGVTTIGEKAFYGCSALSKLVVPYSINRIEDNALPIGDTLKDIYYFGDYNDWISISLGYSPVLETAEIHFLGRGSAYIQLNNGYVLVPNVCSSFSESSYTYCHEIAQYASALSTLVYCENEQRITNGLTALGYSHLQNNFSQTVHNKDYHGDYSPVTFAWKNVADIDTTIVVAIIRGTYNEEWLTNFDIGYGPDHYGFQKAAVHVYEQLSDYLNAKCGNFQSSQYKILVTGHSRGAAVANLVAAYLDNPNLNAGIVHPIDITRENVYAYTFATPNTTCLELRGDSIYDNIFNIVNPEDFVTKVVPSAWGFGRYGISLVLPTIQSMTMSEYISYLAQVRIHYSEYDTGGQYDPYPLGMYDISKYIKSVTEEVTSLSEYANKQIGKIITQYGTLYGFYRFVLGGLLCNTEVYQVLAGELLALTIGGAYGSLGLKTFEFFGLAEVIGRIPGVNLLFNTYFTHAHKSETYLAMLNSIGGIEEYRNKQLFNIVNCPVDVSIYNSEGTLVGQIINNEVQSGNEIWMYVDGDSKIYCLPDEDTYRVELSGNDTGVMDYSTVLEDMDTYKQQKTYHEGLELTTEKIYKTDDTSVYKILTIDENDIEPTAEFDSETGKQLKVDITVEGRGSAPSLSNLTPGDYVTLQAATDSNNEFYGWYDSSGELVSTEAEYSFSIHRDMEFTARFSDVFVGTESMTFEKESVILDKREQYYNKLIIGPENATIQNVSWTTSDENIVRVDNGVILTINPGTAVITATLEDGTSAQYTVTVKEDPVIESKHTLSLDGNIAVNFYFSLADYVKNDFGTKVEFTIDGNTVSQSIGESTEYLEFNRFSVDVSYKQMTTDIHADVILSTGEVVYSEEYRAKDYCDEKLANSTITDKFRNLLETLLNYGGYAQLQFGYKTDDLANADLQDTDVSDVTIEQLAPYKAVTAGSEDGITLAGSTLTLNSLTSIKHYFTIAEGHSISEYTFKLNDEELTPVKSGQMYYVEIPNIASKELDAMYTVTVGDYSITYAALSYAYDHVNRPIESETLKDVCRALYKYNQAADTYFR